MRRHLAIVPILLPLLWLGACGGRADDNAATPPPGEPTAIVVNPDTQMSTTTPTPTGPTATVGALAKARPAGSGDPAWGTQYAFLASSDAASRQITYDLVEWFDGEEAVKACAEEGKKPAENDYCVGYYIRNNNTKLRTLTVYPDAPVILTAVGAPTVVDLATFLSEVGEGSVIRFDVDADRIMKLEHIYLP